jgi:LacI family transcriptional regulator
MTSLADVAELAGVSLATASRVMGSSGYPVAEETRQRVLEAARALDFEPNMLARGLARQRSYTVGVIVHDITDEYFAQIARGIEDHAYAHGLAAFVCNSDRDPDKEMHYVRKLRAMRADAIIFTAGGIHDERYEADLTLQLGHVERAGGVVVRLAPHPSIVPDVGYSNDDGYALAVDHLVGQGHRRIAFVTGPPHLATSRERLDAVTKALRERGLDLAPELIIPGDFTRQGGERAAVALAGRGLPASAVITANDQLAIGLLQGFRTAGVDVPAGVSVVGFDDIPPCAFVYPPLTTVRVPLYDLGSLGMQLVIRLLAGEPRPEPATVPLKLIVRSSTAPPTQ